MTHSRQELLSQRSPEELGEGLLSRERIIYANNGPRASKGAAFLRRIEGLRSSLGITRISEISQLALTDFPVYQAIRPGILHHVACGQNTGSQGKGQSHVQAKISCLMESVEAFCAEARNAALIRGSFEFLKEHHRILDPDFVLPRQWDRRKMGRVPLLWTPAYHVEGRCRVLVPATGVYLLVPPKSYEIPAAFPQTSNGLASGSTYLEASVHALYELIERMYEGLWEAGEARLEALWEQDYKGFDFKMFLAKQGRLFEFQLFAVTLPKTRNLPVVLCHLVNDSARYAGWGCAGDVDTAISRAISEAIQIYATMMNGGREDIPRLGAASRRRREASPMILPTVRTLRIAELKERTLDRRRRYMRAEFDSVVSWLHSRGFRNVCLANLTRVGVEIPVVKAIIPHMTAPKEIEVATCGGLTEQEVIDRQFSLL